MTDLAPVIGPGSSGLWIHPTCGQTQFHRPDEPPSYCYTCSFRTDRWGRVHTTPAHALIDDPEGKP